MYISPLLVSHCTWEPSSIHVGSTSVDVVTSMVVAGAVAVGSVGATDVPVDTEDSMVEVISGAAFNRNTTSALLWLLILVHGVL